MEFIVVNAKTMGTFGGWMTIVEPSMEVHDNSFYVDLAFAVQYASN